MYTVFKNVISRKTSRVEKYLTIFKEFENLSVEKMTLSTALGFEPRSFEISNSTN